MFKSLRTIVKKFLKKINANQLLRLKNQPVYLTNAIDNNTCPRCPH